MADLGVNALLFTVGLQSIPKEPVETARVDGASVWRIYLPMSRSALVVVFILQATWVWNDFLIALILTQSPSTPPVMPLLNALQSVEGGGPGFTIILTAALLVCLPTALLFGFTQESSSGGCRWGSTEGRPARGTTTAGKFERPRF